MFQSNFQKLLQANPSISKKNTQQQNPTLESKTPQRHYAKATNTKFSSMSKKLDTSKVEQLRQLSQLTAITETGSAPIKTAKRDGAARKVLGDLGTRADRSAPAKSLYIPDQQTPREKAEVQRQQQQNLQQIQKQETHIQHYIDTEWWYTKKHQIHVPPLHDPLVMVHHYALGQKNSSVFDMATIESDVKDDRDYQHVLVRVVILTKYGQVIYDKLVQPMDKITDYRTSITGVTREDFQINYNAMKSAQESKRFNKNNDQSSTVFMNPKVVALRDVRHQVAEIIDQRILVGYLLSASPELNELEKQALIHKFSVSSGKRTMNAAQQKELMDDYKVEQSLKNKNYLLDLLQVSHPHYLLRDFAHGKILKLDEFVYNKFILPSLSGFINILQKKHGLAANGTTIGQQSFGTTKGNLIKDNFLSLSRPLDFVSLDSLLNNGMAAYQLYLLLKTQWEAIFKQSHSVQLSHYRFKILELTKAIEERKELDLLNKEAEDKKQQRRDNWTAKHGSGTSKNDDSDDDGDSDDESDSDSDSDDSSSGRW